MLKKSKRRQALKEFEQLQKADPEAALARLEELEQLRMQVLPGRVSPRRRKALPEGAHGDGSLLLCPPGADESKAPEQGKMGPFQGHYGQV